MPWTLRAFGFTGYRIPWYSFTMRFRRISYPILPGCRDAPTPAMKRGKNTASRRALAILAAKLSGDNEPCRPSTPCIITHGNRALRLIYRDGNRGTTVHRFAHQGVPNHHAAPRLRPARKEPDVRDSPPRAPGSHGRRTRPASGRGWTRHRLPLDPGLPIRYHSRRSSNNLGRIEYTSHERERDGRSWSDADYQSRSLRLGGPGRPSLRPRDVARGRDIGRSDLLLGQPVKPLGRDPVQRKRAWQRLLVVLQHD